MTMTIRIFAHDSPLLLTVGEHLFNILQEILKRSLHLVLNVFFDDHQTHKSARL